MSGDLEWNKIFGAGLATALVILGVREVSTRLFASEPPEKPGYAITVAEGGEEGAAAAALPTDWGTVLPVADVAKGEATFKKCASCHDISSGGPNKIGPNLFGVVGRVPGTHGGFAYSDAMKEHVKDAPHWGYDDLDHFLTNPGKIVPGTKMSFAGIKNQEDRANLIAYLRSQGSGSFPIPAPDPARQPGAAAPAAGAAAPAEGAAAPAAAE
ncbi:cytochrome c family protein, partial [Caulobacter sp. 17J65-9]|uniref:c-type cytochrome n=1 Tax=Caulobacter sp. 17J65-9 TaxID=2709382 RepID=UPI0013CCA992